MALLRVPDDARVAYLFADAARGLNAATLEPSGRNLPIDMGKWVYQREFALGIQEVLPLNISPEPMLRGLTSRGYFIWPIDNIEPFGTSQ
jgi:hypothetical protein